MAGIALYRTASWYNDVIREDRPGVDRYGQRHGKGETVHHPHDKGYKSLLSSKKVFLDLLRHFVRSEWVRGLTEDELTRLDKSYITSGFQGRESDVVYKVSGRDILFYVLLEQQSEVDRLMPFRLLEYKLELWRDIVKNAGNHARRQGFRLPVIVPIVLYNGNGPWTVPLDFRNKLWDAERFGGHALDFSYLLIDIQRLDPEELFRQGTLIGSVFMLDQARDAETLSILLRRVARTLKSLSRTENELFWHWAAHVLGRNLVREEREAIAQAIKQSNPKEADVVITNIEKVIKRERWKQRKEGRAEGRMEGHLEGRAEGLAEGRAEGLAEGRKETRRLIAVRMLASGMSLEQVAKFTDLSVEQVKRLAE